MAAETKIEWADATANFWEGCTQVSPACDHCYAKARAERFGTVEWNGPPREVKAGYGVIHALEHRALYHPNFTPLVFVNSLSDFFDKLAPVQWRTKALLHIVRAQRCRFLLLTKRIGNVERMIEEAGHGWPPNAWLGITVVNQEEADRDIPKLLAAKAALKIPRVFLSIEPMLGPIALSTLPSVSGIGRHLDALGWIDPHSDLGGGGVDWVICGGESGRDARPMHPDWARSLRDQCVAAGVPFMFKQWGEFAPVDEDQCPTRFGPDCEAFRTMCSNGFVGPLTKDAIWLHRPRDYPQCWPADQDGDSICNVTLMKRVGKSRAGRLLDGAEHNGRPAP